jgi:hypothetical protein
MANPTTNYSFAMPTNSDLVKDLPADFEVFGQAVDTQMKTNADAATQKATLTTKGDIYAATGASTPARLGVGANDTVLVADSSTATGLKWALPASGGMTLISTTTLSGATTTLSSIPQTYNSLFLIVTRVTANTNDDRLRVLPNNVNNLMEYQALNNGTAYSLSNSPIRLTEENHQRTNANNSWALKIDNYTSSNSFKPVNFYGFYRNTAGSTRSINAGGAFISDTAITSLVFDYGGTNTFAGGTVLLYGVK